MTHLQKVVAPFEGESLCLVIRVLTHNGGARSARTAFASSECRTKSTGIDVGVSEE